MHTDTAGQEKFRALAKMYYQGAHAALLGFDVTKRYTMGVCDSWIREIRGSTNPGCVLVAVGNKIDLVDERQISTEEARTHFEEEDVPYFETSARTGEGVRELFEGVVRLIIERQFSSFMTDANNNEIASEEDEPRDRKEGKCTIC